MLAARRESRAQEKEGNNSSKSNQSPSRAPCTATLEMAENLVVKPARLHFARTARALREATYEACERGDLSEFLAARTCASYWFDKAAPSALAAARYRAARLFSTFLSDRRETKPGVPSSGKPRAIHEARGDRAARESMIKIQGRGVQRW